MQVNKGELLLVYNADRLSDRTTYGYAKGLKNFVLKSIDVNKSILTELQIIEFAKKLGIPLRRLLDSTYETGSIADKDVPKLLLNNPEMMKTPIVIFHDSAEFVHSPFHLLSKLN